MPAGLSLSPCMAATVPLPPGVRRRAHVITKLMRIETTSGGWSQELPEQMQSPRSQVWGAGEAMLQNHRPEEEGHFQLFPLLADSPARHERLKSFFHVLTWDWDLYFFTGALVFPPLHVFPVSFVSLRCCIGIAPLIFKKTYILYRTHLDC